MKKRKIGLFFGSFNPVHIGHIIIANYLVEHTDMNQIWFVVTPLNPFKEKKSLLDNHHRLEMVYRALKKYENLLPSDIEFGLPQPNYTCDTLAYLEEKYPYYDFCLIMGEDNLNTFHKWKNYAWILEQYPIYVYPRVSEGNTSALLQHKNIYYTNAPIIGISATFIRQEISQKKNITPLIDPNVWEYIDQMGFYL